MPAVLPHQASLACIITSPIPLSWTPLCQVLEFKGGLAERAGEVAGPLGHIATALDQLRASPQLRLLLHTALRLGNALNAGRKAPQRGIRLASLKCVPAMCWGMLNWPCGLLVQGFLLHLRAAQRAAAQTWHAGGLHGC